MDIGSVFEMPGTCGVCDSTDLHEILNLGDQPPANSLYPSGEKAPSQFQLRFVFCKACGTVQLGKTVDPHYLFFPIPRLTGTSSTAIEYSYTFADLYWGHFGRCITDTPFALEIASNDGTFPKRFEA